jgi:hypothetical protein
VKDYEFYVLLKFYLHMVRRRILIFRPRPAKHSINFVLFEFYFMREPT